MSKVVLFSRVSTVGQDLVQQNNELYLEAERQGYKKNDIILIEQKESAIKLDEFERVGIQLLKETIESQDVDCVIIYEISRLSRRPQVLYSVRDYLIERNVNLLCIKPYMKLLDNDGKMSQTASILFSLFGSLSESEMMIKQERMMRGRLYKREQGKYIGGNMLFGYTYETETDKILIDESKRDTVIEFFERYSNNESVRSIAKDMMDRGLLPYDDYSTACVMMRRMIRRSEYAGIKASTYDYPAIISQELYNKVRARAASKNKYKTRLSSVYFLQGLIHWKYNNMLMSPWKNAVQYRAWDEKSNTGIMVNMDYIDSLVWKFILQYKKRASGPERINMIDNILMQKIHILQRQNNAIEEHKNIEATIYRINERVVKGKMSDTQGDRLIAEQQDRLKELDNMMNKCKEDMKYLDSEIEKLRNNNNDSYDDITDEQKQDIYKQYVKKVIVEKDNCTSKGRYIYVHMIDGTQHKIHMTKKGNYFTTYIITKDNKEIQMDDIEINKRFTRKIY